MSANLSEAAQRRRALPVQGAMPWGEEDQGGMPPEHEENLAFVDALRGWLGMDPIRDEGEQ